MQERHKGILRKIRILYDGAVPRHQRSGRVLLRHKRMALAGYRHTTRGARGRRPRQTGIYIRKGSGGYSPNTLHKYPPQFSIPSTLRFPVSRTLRLFVIDSLFFSNGWYGGYGAFYSAAAYVEGGGVCRKGGDGYFRKYPPHHPYPAL